MTGSGVYKYVCQNKIIYIGMSSCNITNRLLSHAIDERFKPYLNNCEIYYIQATISDAADIEKFLIRKYNPVLNRIMYVSKQGDDNIQFDEESVEWLKVDMDSLKKKKSFSQEIAEINDKIDKVCLYLDNNDKVFNQAEYVLDVLSKLYKPDITETRIIVNDLQALKYNRCWFCYDEDGKEIVLNKDMPFSGSIIYDKFLASDESKKTVLCLNGVIEIPIDKHKHHYFWSFDESLTFEQIDNVIVKCKELNEKTKAYRDYLQNKLQAFLSSI